MKIVVNAIPAEGMDIAEELSPSDLNLETDQIHYTECVSITAHASREKDIVNVRCNIKSKKRQTCSRCLAEFEEPIVKTVDFVYQLTGEHTITLDENIRDTLILEHPMKMLCRQDCKGLCFHCGKNLNEGPCECGEKKGVMKRWRE